MVEGKYVGSIEAGDTKSILAVRGTEGGEVVAKKRIPTTDAKETLAKSVEFFKERPVPALGVGTLGPIGINSSSKTFGYVLDTPKRDWSGANVRGTFGKELGISVTMATDVNTSCYGEYIVCGRDNSKTYFHITIGTGIDAGAVQAGRLIGLNNHPEMGHTLVTPYPGDDYTRKCPLYGNGCIEGMAAGPSLKGRTGVSGGKLPRDYKVLTYVSYYVAQLLFDTYIAMRPDVMVVGGSALGDQDLVQVYGLFKEFNNNCVATLDVDKSIVHPAVTDNGSTTLSGFELTKGALKNK